MIQYCSNYFVNLFVTLSKGNLFVCERICYLQKQAWWIQVQRYLCPAVKTEEPSIVQYILPTEYLHCV